MAEAVPKAVIATGRPHALATCSSSALPTAEAGNVEGARRAG